MYLYTNNVFIEAPRKYEIIVYKSNIIKREKNLDKEQTIGNRKISSKLLKETTMGDLSGTELRVVSH